MYDVITMNFNKDFTVPLLTAAHLAYVRHDCAVTPPCSAQRQCAVFLTPRAAACSVSGQLPRYRSSALSPLSARRGTAGLSPADRSTSTQRGAWRYTDGRRPAAVLYRATRGARPGIRQSTAGTAEHGSGEVGGDPPWLE